MPGTAPWKVMVKLLPPHTVVSAGFITFGVGFTVILKVSGFPWQLLAVGMMMMRAVAMAVELVAMN